MFAQLSDTGLLIATILLLAVPVILLLYARYRLAKRKPTYRWKPEQDYDVKWQGESMMRPASPVLKKRDKAKR